MPARTILHADMDAFYAAVEQRDRPELRGKPVIVGGQGKRGVVATASYEARRFGVHSAMPGAVARRKCPDGIFVRPRMEHYVEVSHQVRAVFEEVTPLIEPLSLDEAFLDVTASRAAFGSGEEIARRIRARVREETGLTVSVGVAASKFVAKVASDLDKPDGLVVVPPGRERAFLAPLPIKRLWGAGPVTQRKLEALGMTTIGDVQRRSLDELRKAFGDSSGEHFFALARGEDHREVEPHREAKSISNETTFEDDVVGRDRCHEVLLRLSASVGRRLRQHSLVGAIVRLKVRFPPFETHTRQCVLPSPIDDDAEIYQNATALFDRFVDEDQPVRLLGVGVARLSAAGAPQQQGLFGGDKQRRASRAMDAIRERYGDDVIRRGG